jgi:hypothetical protein
VTGGLFLGDDASDALTQTTGHFPDSQDQRNTIRARARYQIAPRLWMALGADYNTGLPFQPDLTPQQYATEYGQVVINHLNFNRDRISPYFTQNLTVGADLLKREKFTTRFQGDIANVGNTLELIDFGGLFSGNAIGPGRQFTFRETHLYLGKPHDHEKSFWAASYALSYRSPSTGRIKVPPLQMQLPPAIHPQGIRPGHRSGCRARDAVGGRD